MIYCNFYIIQTCVQNVYTLYISCQEVPPITNTKLDCVSHTASNFHEKEKKQIETNKEDPAPHHLLDL